MQHRTRISHRIVIAMRKGAALPCRSALWGRRGAKRTCDAEAGWHAQKRTVRSHVTSVEGSGIARRAAPGKSRRGQKQGNACDGLQGTTLGSSRFAPSEWLLDFLRGRDMGLSKYHEKSIRRKLLILFSRSKIAIYVCERAFSRISHAPKCTQ